MINEVRHVQLQLCPTDLSLESSSDSSRTDGFVPDHKTSTSFGIFHNAGTGRDLNNWCSPLFGTQRTQGVRGRY